MMRSAARERVSRARAQLLPAEHEVAIARGSWHEPFVRHRTVVLIGGGVLAGLAVAGIPPRHWSRAGAGLFNAAARLTGSALGPAILTALIARIAAPAAARPQQGGAGTTNEPLGETA